MTATANYEVRDEIIQLLQLENCILFRSSYNRANIFMEVRDKTIYANPLRNLALYLQSTYPDSSGIIYCSSRKECESIANKLRIDYNLKADYYHSLLPDKRKSEVQQNFMSEKIKILVATIAFGMGINKSNIRFVVHFTLPKSFENYYQEIGRAGRDGKRSNAILYFNPNERRTLDYLLGKSGGDKKTKTSNLKKINQIINFCEEKVICRRVLALKYFGEIFTEEKCDRMCDNCNNEFESETINVSKEALNILKFIRFLSISTFKMTTHQASSYMKGLKLEKFKTFGFLLRKNTNFFGCMKDWDLADIIRLIRILIIDGYLIESVEVYYENVCCYLELDGAGEESIDDPSKNFEISISFIIQKKRSFIKKLTDKLENKSLANTAQAKVINSDQSTYTKPNLKLKTPADISSATNLKKNLNLGDDYILNLMNNMDEGGSLIGNQLKLNRNLNKTISASAFSNRNRTVDDEEDKVVSKTYLECLSNKRQLNPSAKEQELVEKKPKKTNFI